jgi:hypothetical protein
MRDSSAEKTEFELPVPVLKLPNFQTTAVGDGIKDPDERRKSAWSGKPLECFRISATNLDRLFQPGPPPLKYRADGVRRLLVSLSCRSPDSDRHSPEAQSGPRLRASSRRDLPRLTSSFWIQRILNKSSTARRFPARPSCTNCANRASRLVMVRTRPFSRTATRASSTCRTIVARFFDPRGRPLGFPELPCLNCV